MQVTKSDQGILVLSQSPLNKTMTEFLLAKRAGGCSRGTIEFYTKKLSLLERYLKKREIHSLTEVTPAHLRAFLLAMGETHNPGGVHGIFRAVRALFRWYEAEYQPSDWANPIAKVKPPKLKQEPLEPIDLADLKAMLMTCAGKTLIDMRDRAILLALLDTGCRASEFVSLDVGDVNLTTGAVHVRSGKGGKGRITFLGAKARRELVRYLRLRPDARPSDPLWATETGSRLTHAAHRHG